MAQKKPNWPRGERPDVHDIDAPFLGMICPRHSQNLAKTLTNTFVQNRQTCFEFCTIPLKLRFFARRGIFIC
jgi:hypothetical protein